MASKIYYRPGVCAESIREWRDREFDHDRLDSTAVGFEGTRALL